MIAIRSSADFASASLLASLFRITKLVVCAVREELLAPSGSTGGFSLTWKRLAVLLFLASFLVINCLVQSFGLFLDHVLFWKWSRYEVNRPVFVVSNARSGSTLLHRTLLASNTALTSPALWEILFAQSITFRAFFFVLHRIDALFFFDIFYRLIASLDARLDRWSLVNAPHPFSLLSPEEDEWMLCTLGASQLLALVFPQLGAGSPLARLAKGESLSAEERHTIYGFYRQLIQRHLYFAEHWRGIPGPRYLAKNPTFTLRLDHILDAFEDCQIIVAVRDPYSTVPSMISYISRWWHLVASPEDEYPQSAFLLELCNLHYTKPLEAFERLGPTRMTFVEFHDLAKNRWAVAERVDEFLGLPLEHRVVHLETDGSNEAVYHHQYSVAKTLAGLSDERFEELCTGFKVYPKYSRISQRQGQQ